LAAAFGTAEQAAEKVVERELCRRLKPTRNRK